MAPSPDPVTEQRRRLILWVLWVHGPGNPPSITKLLQAHEIEWPQADWRDAVKEPYALGVRQHLDAMCRRKDGRVRSRVRPRLYEWNPDVLTPRTHAARVLDLRRRGRDNAAIAQLLGIASPGYVSALYHDPFGLVEKERKTKYCAGCGAPKDEEQTVCTGCVRKARLEREDRAESLLPDRAWALSLRPRLLMPVDFTVYEDQRRVLVVHTGRGRFERQLCRGESWEHALAEAGVLTTREEHGDRPSQSRR